MADEGVVLDRDAFADESVAGDLAAPADRGVLLNLDERPNPGFVSDGAPVQVDEFSETDVLAEPDVRRNFGVLVQAAFTL
jgi:hypothetical protein